MVIKYLENQYILMNYYLIITNNLLKIYSPRKVILLFF